MVMVVRSIILTDVICERLWLLFGPSFRDAHPCRENHLPLKPSGSVPHVSRKYCNVVAKSLGLPNTRRIPKTRRTLETASTRRYTRCPHELLPVSMLASSSWLGWLASLMLEEAEENGLSRLQGELVGPWRRRRASNSAGILVEEAREERSPACHQPPHAADRRLGL